LITFSAVRPESIPGLAERLAAEDLREISRRGWASPADAIRDAVDTSHEAFMASWDGEVQAVFGVTPLPGKREEGEPAIGVPWLLSAAPPPCLQMEFMGRAEDVVARWRRTFPVLVSSVDAERTRAGRWLVSLGFTSHTTQHYNGFPFTSVWTPAHV
jgi:hypothetical protein